MKFFAAQIHKWFKKYGRHDLPWRRKDISPYEVWISEIMLQQTQVERVIKYYHRFLKRFPTIQDLSKTTWEEFLPYYEGLGYYQRGKNMLKTAKIIVEEYNGEFPKDPTILESLPGIGKYTARALLSFSHNLPYLAFDTNLKRVFGRFLFGKKDASLNEKKLTDQLTHNSKDINGALMDFANLVCTNKQPRCIDCPLKKKCTYAKENGGKEKISFVSRISFPLKKAQVFLYLHKDHKEYFSKNKNIYEVFKLTADINTRKDIKKYFKEKYSLEISVRPPHKKTYENTLPTLHVNAQILLGKHSFKTYSKKEVLEMKKENKI